jgi:hypothetical protein
MQDTELAGIRQGVWEVILQSALPPGFGSFASVAAKGARPSTSVPPIVAIGG